MLALKVNRGSSSSTRGIEPQAFQTTATNVLPEPTPLRTFSRHCVDEFEWLARNAPGQLARLATSPDIRADPVWLSGVYEAMALNNFWRFEKILLDGLRHEKPFVRESALIGASRLLERSFDLREAAREIAVGDRSEAVREVANDLLSSL